MAEDDLLSSPPPLPLIPFLPDDISVRCIARVPVSSHTALSHVSRSWRSFVRSPPFFSLRSELAVTELVLTVSVRRINSDRSRWYHLHPHRTPSRLPPPQEQQQEDDLGSASASLGPHIFLLGGISSPTSLQIYDSRLRRWAHGPPMSTPRKFAAAGVAGGRIHVLGSCMNPRTTPSAESLDPTGTRWDPLPSVPSRLFGRWTWRSVVIDGKLIVLSKGPQPYAAAFDPATAEWGPAPPWCLRAPSTNSLAVVGGVPYIFSNSMERILGYGNDGKWRPVEGEVEKELLCHLCNITLREFGALLCLVGEEKEMRDDLIGISCAGIDISRTADGGFRGSIVWLDSGLLKLSLEESLRHCVVLEL